MRLTLVLTLALLFYRCQNSNKIGEDAVVTPIEFSIKDSKKLVGSDIFEKFDYIPLETIEKISIVSEISKVIVTEDRIFVFEDHRDIRSLFVFNREGKFLFKLSSGEGPESFAGANDVFIDNSKKVIEILDKQKIKIVYFDWDGKFISYVPLKEQYDEFVKIDSKYIFSTGNEGSSDKRIQKFDLHYVHDLNKGEVEATYVDIPDYLFGVNFTALRFSTQSYNNHYLFSPYFSQIIYEVNKEKTIPKYLFKPVQNLWIDQDFLDAFGKSKANIRLELLNRYDKIQFIRSFEEYQNWVVATFFLNKRLYTVFYNKMHKNSLAFYQSYGDIVANDIDGGIAPYVPFGRYKDYTIYFLDAFQVKNHLNSMQQTNKTSSIFYQKLKNTKESDNPILVLAKLKNL